MTIDHSNFQYIEVYRNIRSLLMQKNTLPEEIHSLCRFVSRSNLGDIQEQILSLLESEDLSLALSVLEEKVSLKDAEMSIRRFSSSPKDEIVTIISGEDTNPIASSGDSQEKEEKNTEVDAFEATTTEIHGKEEQDFIEQPQRAGNDESITSETGVVTPIEIETKGVEELQTEKAAQNAQNIEDTNTNSAECDAEAEEGKTDNDDNQEITFDERLRNYLIKRFRRPQKERERPTPPKNLRWDLWAEQTGGQGITSLSDSPVIAKLAEHGITTIAELLLLVPASYQRIAVQKLQSENPTEEIIIRGIITQKYQVLNRFMKRWVVVLQSKDGVELQVRWIATEPRSWGQWSKGQSLALVGHVQLEEQLEMIDPEIVGVDGRGSGILAQYEIDGVSDRDIRDLIGIALIQIQGNIQDCLPKEIVDQAEQISLDDALRDVHFPANQNYKGYQRMAFQEIFLHHIGRRISQGKANNVQGMKNSILHGGIAKLSQVKKINLSDEQERVFSEIKRDLFSGKAMKRLLQGDVGAGKPLVALLSAISILKDDVLVVYVCEDALSVERRFLFAEGLLKMLSISTYTLLDQPNRAQFDALKKQGGLVFANRQALESRLLNLNIRLVIVEENQNLGSFHDYTVFKRRHVPDLLVLTPTPQPMVALETVYADLDISLIEQTNVILPQCAFLTSKFRQQAYQELFQEIQNGRQGYIVLPSKDGKDLLDVKGALQMAGALKAEFLKDVRIGVYCSEMTHADRLKVFDDFQSRRIDVLLATTAIEENPAVENVNFMIVEMAERFPMMRLHRLRGHIGAAHYPAACRFILSNNPSTEDVDRISLVCQEYSGFVLTEKMKRDDLQAIQYRWVGDEDRDIRMLARELSKTLSYHDIQRTRWPLLQSAIQKRWGEKFEVPEVKRSSKRKRYRGKTKYRRKGK